MSTLKLTRYRDQKRRVLVSRRESQSVFLKWVLCRTTNKKIFSILLKKFDSAKYFPILETQLENKKFNLSIVDHDSKKYIYNAEYYQNFQKLSNESKNQILKRIWIDFRLKHVISKYNSSLLYKHKYKMFELIKLLIRNRNFYNSSKLEKQNFLFNKVHLNIYNYFTYRKPNFSITRVRNQCRITGEMSAILRKFRLSRKSFGNAIKTTKRFVGIHNAASTSRRAKHRLCKLTQY